MTFFKPRNNKVPKTALGVMGDVVMVLIALGLMVIGHFLILMGFFILWQAGLVEGFRNSHRMEDTCGIYTLILLGSATLSFLCGGYDICFGPGYPRSVAKFFALAWFVLLVGFFSSVLSVVIIKFLLGAVVACLLVYWFAKRKRPAAPAVSTAAATDPADWLPAEEVEDEVQPEDPAISGSAFEAQGTTP